MAEVIQTIETDRWSEPDENHCVRHIGMIKAREAFDQLYTHLQAKNLLPDEYFLFSESDFPNDAELPEFSTIICHTNFGGSEGIYMDIIIKAPQKLIPFATGKTLSADADAFFHMSRIAAECSLMLNAGGGKYPKNNVDAVFTPEESQTLGAVIEKTLCELNEPKEREMLERLLSKVCPVEEQDDIQSENEAGYEEELEP